MKPAYTRHRTDTGSQALVDYLRKAGVEFEPLGGAIDGVAWYRGRVALVDFKARETSAKTKRQQQLLARDCPICWVWDERSARVLVTALKGVSRTEWEANG